MPVGTVRVKGLREAQAAFRKYDKQLGKDLRNELKTAAKPVVETVKTKLARFQGVSMNIAPRATGRSVFVRQQAKKVTGQRGDFGSLQMRKAFIPALEERSGDVARELEQALDRFANNAGL